jgi:enoyl-CoA hydratase
MLASVFETIIFDICGDVAVLTINRPAVLNALNRQTLVAELLQAVREIGLDDKVRGAIITGAGPKAFAAGADIKELAVMTPIEAQTLSHQGHALMDAIENLGKPVDCRGQRLRARRRAVNWPWPAPSVSRPRRRNLASRK